MGAKRSAEMKEAIRLVSTGVSVSQAARDAQVSVAALFRVLADVRAAGIGTAQQAAVLLHNGTVNALQTATGDIKS